MPIQFLSSLSNCPKSVRSTQSNVLSTFTLYRAFCHRFNLESFFNFKLKHDLHFNTLSWWNIIISVLVIQSWQGHHSAGMVGGCCQSSRHIGELIFFFKLSYLPACCFLAQANRKFIFSPWISSLLVLRQSNSSIFLWQ